ncbi:hypothetical protein M406DRAFT_98346 [Cryphonectria parasitica EP155]|uniref:Zinc finger C2H2 LYAR-type domain-containing protein n=1 Tax=Cryphonectria parasitica (strain ATCC 38755 / EP155) TaxID=660469 RepID=A0A9P5CMW7_CRYP1|nr:uncharacterized protein M406DRAFT_98346 [Cryphonectria parasitica EP155]KAF3764824.1 hypothetical protein M406DRAFT_98346 [Cryphonectria parasitica EP155]
MVSFQCEACGDVLTKKKLDPHRNRCRAATFTCIDCMVHFYGTDYRSHTSCMTEEQKYQGALYKNKKAKTTDRITTSVQNNNNYNSNNNDTNSNGNNKDNMAHRAYVEEVPDYDGWEKPANPPPPAPSPPPANDFNVFEYMVNPTPTASAVALPTALGPSEAAPSEQNQLAMISYGTGPILGVTFETPLPRDGKKDKKRKRLHIDTHDLEMTDAPGLHTGLTGGMSKMLSRPQTLPSPDYSGSGGEFGETPASPLKKSRHSKHHRSSRPVSGIGNNIMSMLTNSGTSNNPTSKANKRKSMVSTTTTSSKKRHSHHRSRHLEGAKEPRLLEYKSESTHERDGHRSGAGPMVVFGQRADLFFSMVNKGPESQRGCSFNKALKRFHRERSGAGNTSPKPLEEKELFRSLRMKRNDRGEIVLFSV